jgi:hypothetical protein
MTNSSPAKVQLLTVTFGLLVLIAAARVHGQGEPAGLREICGERFEEALRWKLSSGDPSGNTKVEVSGSQVRITLTGGKFWNEATAGFDAKYFGLLCLLWDTQARDEAQYEYVLSDSFDVTLVQEPDKIVARTLVKRADFPTLSALNTAILLTKSQVRDILKGQAVQSTTQH